MSSSSLLSRFREFRRRFKNPKVFSKTATLVKKKMPSKKNIFSSSRRRKNRRPASQEDAQPTSHNDDDEEEKEQQQEEENEEFSVNESSSSSHRSGEHQQQGSMDLSSKPTHLESIDEEASSFLSEQHKDSIASSCESPIAKVQGMESSFQDEVSMNDVVAGSFQAKPLDDESVLSQHDESKQASFVEIEVQEEEEPQQVVVAEAVVSVVQEKEEEKEEEVVAPVQDTQEDLPRFTFPKSERKSALRTVLSNPRLRFSTSPSRASLPPAAQPTAETAPVVSSEAKPLRMMGEAEMEQEMKALNAKTFKEQAVRFLNAFWFMKLDAEKVWQITNAVGELAGEGSTGLDELKAHRILEKLDNALTITEMRNKLKTLRPRYVSLSELLVFVFQVDWRELVTAPEGSADCEAQMLQADLLMQTSSNAVSASREMAAISSQRDLEAGETAKAAQESKAVAYQLEEEARIKESQALEAEEAVSLLVAQAQTALDACTVAANQAKESEQATLVRLQETARLELEAKQGEEFALKAEASAQAKESNAREAESEAFRKEKLAQESEISAIEAEKALVEATERVEMALNRIKAEEAQFAQKVADLRVMGEDMSKGLVVRRKAQHELEVLLANNPDYLLQARIGEEAIVRKHAKLIKSANLAKHRAMEDRTEAESLKSRAIEFRSKCENATSEAQIRRSASETKAQAAAAALVLSEEAQAIANEQLRIAREFQDKANEALANAEQAKESASLALASSAKATKDATASRENAEIQELDAIKAKRAAEESRESAEKAVLDAIQAFENAQKFVERIKKQASSGQGGWWWASREMEDAKRFVPQRMLKKMEQF